MDSEAARKLIRGRWSEWRHLDLHGLAGVPKTEGVYVVRARRQLARLYGKSDIIYVGKGILSKRIGRSLAPLNGKKTAPCYAWLLSKVLRDLRIEMEFSYLEMSEPEKAEMEIIEAYFNAHYELPPVNRVGRVADWSRSTFLAKKV